MTTANLFDKPGPRAARRTTIFTVGAIVLIAIVLACAVVELSAKGQFEAAKWSPLKDPKLILFLLHGLQNTIGAAAVSLVLALMLGIGLAVGRLSDATFVRVPCVVIVELARAAPVLLSMLFLFLAFPLAFHIDLSAFWTVVLALTFYNGAAIAEIVRAGVLTLPSGQREAAYAIGLRWWQTMRLILLPQALRVMLPSLISQLIVLIKDSALGFIVGYQELAAQAQSAALLFNNPLQTYVVVGLVFVLLNSALSWVSAYVSRRQARTDNREQATVVGPEIAVAADLRPFDGGRRTG
jgi:glutamate transport system permease protein